MIKLLVLKFNDKVMSPPRVLGTICDIFTKAGSLLGGKLKVSPITLLDIYALDRSLANGSITSVKAA